MGEGPPSLKIDLLSLPVHHAQKLKLPSWQLCAQNRHSCQNGNRDVVMHVISREPFVLAAQRFPNQAGAIDGLYHELKRTRFTDPVDLKATYPSLDRMKYREKWWVIDIGGGHLRVMFFADFERGKIFIKHITTHAEYDKLIKYYREMKE
jgi:mRNA interferase HigB